MKGTGTGPGPSKLRSQLKTLMFLRVVLVSLFLGAGIIFQLKGTATYFGHIRTYHFVLIAVIYLLTLVYAIALRFTKNLVQLAYTQILADTFLITWIIHATGGKDSLFSLLYILAIIAGSTILYRKGGLITASACTLLYGLLLYTHWKGLIPPPVPEREALFSGRQILYTYFVNVLGFYLVALFASYLSEQARSSSAKLEETRSDLNSLELLNRSIISSINSGLIALDRGGRIILFNPAAEKIFGLRADEAMDKQIKDVIPLSGTTLEQARIGHSSGPLAPHQTYLDIQMTRKDGKKLQLRYSVSPLRLFGRNGLGSLLVFQDITEIKQIEDEMRKVEGLALVGELAAGVAHEIRNPLASISGSIEMLKEVGTDKEFSSRLMDIILTEVGRLNQLVNDFLLFARPKKANLTDIELGDLINETLELFQNSPYWNDKMKLKTHLTPPLPIRSDPEQLKQVLWNLLLNASHEISGGGTLEVSASAQSQGNLPQEITIQIRDTGKGFQEEILTKIFTPFFTTKEDGSGLGLAIVKRIVEGLGGSIKAENHPEGGALITILLPARGLS